MAGWVRGVALRAALSAAPEPRLRRVSGIRLQSLTQGQWRAFRARPAMAEAPKRLALAVIAPTPARRTRYARSASGNVAKPGSSDRPASHRVNAASRDQAAPAGPYAICAAGVRKQDRTSFTLAGGNSRTMTARIRTVAHRPVKPAPFPFSSGDAQDGRHCRIPLTS